MGYSTIKLSVLLWRLPSEDMAFTATVVLLGSVFAGLSAENRAKVEISSPWFFPAEKPGELNDLKLAEFENLIMAVDSVRTMAAAVSTAAVMKFYWI